MLKHLDLFSGIGGFSLGLERTGGFETIGFCEIDPFCRKVLRKHWPDVPIWEDVRTINGWLEANNIRFDVLTGGYPCQPFSHAGKRRGAEDDRHLWPAMFDVIKAFRPTWIIGENVAGHISLGLDDVLFDLEGSGYSTQVFVIPACAVDAPHRRDRVWIVAHCYNGHEFQNQTLCARRDAVINGGEDVADTEGERRREAGPDSQRPQERTTSGGDVRNTACSGQQVSQGCQTTAERDGLGAPSGASIRNGTDRYWLPEPAMGRVAHGVPNRVDRLKGLGNAVVPQIPEAIGRAILES